jgi:hypothetical protein
VNRLTESLALVVTAVNDAPVRTAGTLTPIRVSVNSANTTAVTLGLAGLSYGPGGPDEAAQKLTYKVTAIPAYVQIFKANGTTRVNVGGSLTATDLKGLKYKTVANASGTGNLIWTVTDNGSGTAPNVNRLSESLPISVTPLLARSQAESEGAPPASAATVGSAAAGVSEAFVLPFRPWQNATLCEDVNGDSVVTALDVLVIINYLNTQGSGSLPFSPPDSSGTPKFFDVNGDGQCTPLDTLQVINFLNAAASTISGEGESLPAGDAAGLPRVAASHDRLVDAVVSEYESVDLDGLLDVLASDRVS